jgi:hypothetical protein
MNLTSWNLSAKRQMNRHRRQTLGGEAKLLLLKAEGGSLAYTSLKEVSEDWSFSGAPQGGPGTFRVARIDEAFAALVRETSHLVVVGSDNAALNNQLFAVERGTATPTGASAFTRIHAQETGKRYKPA